MSRATARATSRGVGTSSHSLGWGHPYTGGTPTSPPALSREVGPAGGSPGCGRHPHPHPPTSFLVQDPPMPAPLRPGAHSSAPRGDWGHWGTGAAPGKSRSMSGSCVTLSP